MAPDPNLPEYMGIAKIIAGGLAAKGPLTKLIEQFGEAMGVITKPWQIERNARAEAKATELKAYADQKAMLIQDNAEAERAQRADYRMRRLENSRQLNLEEIFEKSANHLPESVSETPVNEDWRTRFITHAQDISSEELKEVYAKILANEIAQPGNFSLRTLDVLRNLSPDEAQLFNHAVAISNSLGVIFKIPKPEGGYIYDFTDYGLSFGQILRLRDAGLIEHSDSGAHRYDGENFGEAEGWFYQYFDYRGNRLTLYKKDRKSFELNTYNLTRAGKELLAISKVSDNLNYLRALGAALDQKGFATKIYDFKTYMENENPEKSD